MAGLKLKTIESILDLAPKHTGPGAVGFAGGWGSEIHKVPALTPNIRSTAGQIVERHAPNDSAVIGKSPAHIQQNHQSFGPGEDHAVLSHKTEGDFLDHMANNLGYQDRNHMATSLSTPEGPVPMGKARGGRARAKLAVHEDDEED